MIETETRIEEREVEEVTAYICDVCEKRYDDVMEMQEFFRIRFTGGYGSVFGDMCQYELDMCQHCAKEMLGEYVRLVDDKFGRELEAFDKLTGSGLLDGSPYMK